MQDNIVAHPETGRPALEVKSYVELDRTQLEQEVQDNQAALDQLVADKRAAFEASLDEDSDVVTARGAVSNSKSKLETYDSIAPVAGSDTSEEGASVEEPSADEAGVEPSDSGSGSEDSDESDTGEAVAVPVTVVDETEAEEATEEASEEPAAAAVETVEDESTETEEEY